MNIFENAKFGDKFRTRDGHMAVFVGITRPEDTYRFKVLVEGYGTDDLYCWCGRTNMHAEDRPYDIVGKWKEPINEEELDRIADEYLSNNDNWNAWFDSAICEFCDDKEQIKGAFTAGFLRGVEHISVILCNNYDKNIWTKEE